MCSSAGTLSCLNTADDGPSFVKVAAAGEAQPTDFDVGLLQASAHGGHFLERAGQGGEMVGLGAGKAVGGGGFGRHEKIIRCPGGNRNPPVGDDLRPRNPASFSPGLRLSR